MSATIISSTITETPSLRVVEVQVGDKETVELSTIVVTVRASYKPVGEQYASDYKANSVSDGREILSGVYQQLQALAGKRAS